MCALDWRLGGGPTTTRRPRSHAVEQRVYASEQALFFRLNCAIIAMSVSYKALITSTGIMAPVIRRPGPKPERDYVCHVFRLADSLQCLASQRDLATPLRLREIRHIRVALLRARLHFRGCPRAQEGRRPFDRVSNAPWVELAWRRVVQAGAFPTTAWPDRRESR